MGKKRKYESEPMEVQNLELKKELNYRQMCNMLGQSFCSGKQKENQLEYFARFFDYEETGDKCKRYIIHEVYDKPKAKGYIMPSKSIYTKYAEIILLGHLYTNKTGNGYETYLTNKEMWRLFGLGNEKFESYMPEDRHEELVEKINNEQDVVKVTKSDISMQYELHMDKFYQIVRSTLESLARRSLIRYNKRIMIKAWIYDKHNVLRTNQYEVRVATPDEESYILAAQRDALKELYLSDLVQVFLYNKKEKFYEIVNQKLSNNPETMHIISYWETYHIIYNNEIIPPAVQQDILQLNQLCMNCEVRKYINDKNLKKTNDDKKKYEELKELNEIFGYFKEDDKEGNKECKDKDKDKDLKEGNSNTTNNTDNSSNASDPEIDEEWLDDLSKTSIEELEPKDYLELGKVFDKITMDLGIKDEQLLSKAREIVEDKEVFNSVVEEIFRK